MADSDTVPYLQAYGNITKVLERIQSAAVPDKFTQDFLSTKLNMPGGSARPSIKYLKRAGFLASDGTPTSLYRRFKNSAEAGAAAAEGIKNAYSSLYEVNEYAHDLTEEKLKGVILQVTGLEADSKLAAAMLGSFKAFKAFADFSESNSPDTDENNEGQEVDPSNTNRDGSGDEILHRLKLGYTINLNLPATTDIAVFNAIFKSLREHLLS